MIDASLAREFPVLSTQNNGRRLVYLDSTATSLKPRYVLQKIQEYYETYSANVFRGIYPISERATEEYEGSRTKVAKFIGAKTPEEVIFTRNTTESINLVAYAWGNKSVGPGDSICTTIMEHHSNFVPWQQLTKEKDATLSIWNITHEGRLNLDELDNLITRKTKLLAFTALSNVLGTINPIKEIISKAKKLNPSVLILVDAAQWVPHMAISVTEWGADFVVFSGHKMMGPTGIGVLWGKREILDQMVPFNYGGEMIKEVNRDFTLFKDIPHKYEAGTPHIAGAIGLAAAVEYLTKLGMFDIRKHEEEITSYALKELRKIVGLRILGPGDANSRGGIVAFQMKKVHAHDIAQVLADENICIRAGNHCAMPLHEQFGIAATARVSFYVYTTKHDIDAFIQGLEKVTQLFS